MIVKIPSKRQVTFPASVLKALGVGPGDHLEIQPSPEGFLIRLRRVDRSRLAPAARAALLGVFASGLVSPLNCSPVLKAIGVQTVCGLMDRLIAEDHQRQGVVAALVDVRRSSQEERQQVRSLLA